MSNSLRSPLLPARLLCAQDFPGKSTGVGCHALLQGIFLTQGSNLHLLLGRRILYYRVTWEAPYQQILYSESPEDSAYQQMGRGGTSLDGPYPDGGSWFTITSFPHTFPSSNPKPQACPSPPGPLGGWLLTAQECVPGPSLTDQSPPSPLLEAGVFAEA